MANQKQSETKPKKAIKQEAIPSYLVTTARSVFDVEIYRQGHHGSAEEVDFAAFLRAGGSDDRRPNRFFDPAYYSRRLHEVGRAPGFANLLLDYLFNEVTSPPDPHPLYCRSYYIKTNRDLEGFDGNVYAHFVLHGSAEHRECHPLFDTGRIATQAQSLDMAPPTLIEFLDDRRYWSISPNLYFDPTYYLDQAGEINVCPILHYVEIGWRRGHSPSAIFDTEYYCRSAGNDRPSWQDPLSHFLGSASDSISPHPLFDPAFYADVYGNVGMNPYEHYVRYGMAEGRTPSPLIDLDVLARLRPGSSVSELALYSFRNATTLLREPALAATRKASQRRSFTPDQMNSESDPAGSCFGLRDMLRSSISQTGGSRIVGFSLRSCFRNHVWQREGSNCGDGSGRFVSPRLVFSRSQADCPGPNMRGHEPRSKTDDLEGGTRLSIPTTSPCHQFGSRMVPSL